MICIYTTQKELRILNILNFFVYLIFALRARMNYTKKLRIFNILNFLCVVFMENYILIILAASIRTFTVLYIKTTHWTIDMWSYIAGYLRIKVQ